MNSKTFLGARWRAPSDEKKAELQARVEIERVDLRELLMIRDREAYNAACLGRLRPVVRELDLEEVALLDLELDPTNRALRIATRAERLRFDRAVVKAAEANLDLLINTPFSNDDEAAVLWDLLVKAIGRWEPRKASLSTWLNNHVKWQRVGGLAYDRWSRRCKGIEPDNYEVELHWWQYRSPPRESDPLIRAAIERLEALTEEDHFWLLHNIETAPAADDPRREQWSDGLGKSSCQWRIKKARRKAAKILGDKLVRELELAG